MPTSSRTKKEQAEIDKAKKKAAQRIQAQNVRLVLYFIYKHFGLPTGVRVAIKPLKTGHGWPTILFTSLSPPSIGSARVIVKELLFHQSEQDGVLTPETISLFEECLKELLNKSDIRFSASAPNLVKNNLKILLTKLNSNDSIRVASICRAEKVYYAGKELLNDRIHCFLTPEVDSETGENYIIDLLSGRKYKPTDLLLSLPE